MTVTGKQWDDSASLMIVMRLHKDLRKRKMLKEVSEYRHGCMFKAHLAIVDERLARLRRDSRRALYQVVAPGGEE